MRRAVAIVLVVFLSFLSLSSANLSYANWDHEKADRWNANKAEELRKYGFIQGYNGDLMTEKLLTRQQLAVLICELNGVKDAASRYDVTPVYKDLNKIPTWSRNYIAYCQKERWMVGKEGIFDPTGVVSGQELARVLLNALGYFEVPWKDSLSFIKTLGIAVPARKNMTRGQSFDAMWDAVSRPVMKSGEILGVKTGRLGEGAVAFRATKFEMVSLKSFRVHFNTPVDPNSVEPEKLLIQLIEKSAEDLGGISDRRLSIGTPHVVRAEAVLGGMAVDFYLSAPIQHQVNVHYDVFGIRSAKNGDVQHTMALYSGVMNILDQSLPTVERVVITGDKRIEIVFSEPIATIGSVEIDDGKSGLSVSKYGVHGLGTNTLGFNVSGTFQKGNTYTFKVKDFKDLAGYPNVHNTLTAFIGGTAPGTVPTVVAGGQTFDYVELVFSSAVKGLTKEKFYHSYDIYKALKITKGDSFSSEEVKPYEYIDRVYVWFYDYTRPNAYAIPGEGTTLHIDGTKIVDGFGTALGKLQMAVMPQNQIEAPRVLAVQLVDLSTLKVVFDRPVREFKVTVVDMKSRDGMGPTVDLKKPAKEFIVKLAGPARGDLAVLITDAVDAGIGGMKQREEANFLVDVGDRIAPKVDYIVRNLKDGKAFLYIGFDEVVDKGALIASNYQILVNTPDGQVFRPLTNKPSFLGSFFSVVVIELTDEEFRSMASRPGKVYIKNVADAAGNAINEVAEINENIPFNVASAYTQGRNEVVVKMLGSVDVVNPEGFKLGTEDLAVGSVSFDQNGDTILTLVLTKKEKFSEQMAGANPGTLVIKQGAIANLLGEGNSGDITHANVIDKAKPYIEKIELLSVGANRSISVLFNELLLLNEQRMADDFLIEADGVVLVPNQHFVAELAGNEKLLRLNLLDIPLVKGGNKSVLEAKAFKVTFVPNFVKDKKGNIAEEYEPVILKNQP